MERDRALAGFSGGSQRGHLRFGHTVVPIGLLVGIGIVGTIDGGVVIQAIIAAVTAIVLAAGIDAGLKRLASRYLSGVGRGETIHRGVDPAGPIAADGSGDRE